MPVPYPRMKTGSGVPDARLMASKFFAPGSTVARMPSRSLLGIKRPAGITGSPGTPRLSLCVSARTEQGGKCGVDQLVMTHHSPLRRGKSRPPVRVPYGSFGGSLCANSGHSSSTTMRISSEMAETFSISSMYLCSRRRSAGVMMWPPTKRGE